MFPALLGESWAAGFKGPSSKVQGQLAMVKALAMVDTCHLRKTTVHGGPSSC